MQTSEINTGQVLNYLIHRNKKHPLSEKFDLFLALLHGYIHQFGIINVQDELLERLFRLRIDILSDPSLLEEMTRELGDNIDQIISDQFNKESQHKKLELFLVQALNTYKKIASSIINPIDKGNISNISKDISYQGIVDSLELLPTKDREFHKNYLTTSVMLDYSTLVAFLILNDQLEVEIEDEEIEQLCKLIRLTTEEFGVYSHFLGIWSPSIDDESHWVVNIRIRIGILDRRSDKSFKSAESAIEFLQKL